MEVSRSFQVPALVISISMKALSCHLCTISRHEQNYYWYIWKFDNGIEIDEDKIANIFDMVYLTSEVSDGSGLGLYIVKNAADKLHGLIEVSSKTKSRNFF